MSSDDEDEIAYRDDEEAITQAVFRYNVVAPIVDAADLPRGEVSAQVKELVERTHYLPGKGPIRVSERTVYEWIRRFRERGIEALRPRLRKDRGVSRVLSKEEIARAVQLRKEQPKRFTSTLLDILVREGALKGSPPHRATLDRHLDRLGASRKQMQIIGTKRTIKMEFGDFGDLWVGDYHHGPLVLAPNGDPTTAKLGAFIDHKTRYPVADRYYLSENLATLRDTLLRALLRFGPPKKAYVDRGSVYRAEQLAYSLRRIDCILIHSRAFYSQGRGVIEKWWQVAKAFEAEIAVRSELVTIHELNRLWEAWRQLRYCDEIHSELGKSPNEAIALVQPKPIDPDVARELFLVGAKRKVNKKTACVSIERHSFLCESWLRNRWVEVRFDPSDFSSVVVYLDKHRVQRAYPRKVNEPPEPHPVDPAEPARQSVDYLALLRRDYDQRLLEHAKPLAYADLDTDDAFDAEAFVKTVCDLAGLSARSTERRELASFWDIYGPLPESLVRIATEHAIRTGGRGRHPQVYLHAIRTLVLAHWRGPPTSDKEKQR